MARAIPASLRSREASASIASMEADLIKAYNQDDATGFIRLNALRLKVTANVRGKKK